MKIQLKRSSVLNDGTTVAKQPQSNQLEYGELAVNFNVVDPAIFIKGSDDSVLRIAGANSVGTADTLQEVTNQGNSTTNTIVIDRSQDGGLQINNTNDTTDTALKVTYNALEKFTVQANGNVDTQGALAVAEGAAFAKTLSVAGVTTLADVDVTTLDTTGAVTVGSTLGVTDAVTVGSTLGVTGTTTLAEVTATNLDTTTLDTTGAVTVGSTLGVTGTSTLADVTAANIDSTSLDTTGAVTVGTTLGVTSNTTLGGTVGITGDTTIATNKIVFTASTGNATFAGTITPNGYSFASLDPLP